MQVTRSGRHYPLASFVVWREDVLRQLTRMVVPFDCSCSVTVKYWRGDERRRDVPGMIDALWHVFELAKIVTDDKLFEEVHWIPMGLDRKNPRVEIDIKTR